MTIKENKNNNAVEPESIDINTKNTGIDKKRSKTKQLLRFLISKIWQFTTASSTPMMLAIYCLLAAISNYQLIVLQMHIDKIGEKTDSDLSSFSKSASGANLMIRKDIDLLSQNLTKSTAAILLAIDEISPTGNIDVLHDDNIDSTNRQDTITKQHKNSPPISASELSTSTLQSIPIATKPIAAKDGEHKNDKNDVSRPQQEGKIEERQSMIPKNFSSEGEMATKSKANNVPSKNLKNSPDITKQANKNTQPLEDANIVSDLSILQDDASQSANKKCKKKSRQPNGPSNFGPGRGGSITKNAINDDGIYAAEKIISANNESPYDEFGERVGIKESNDMRIDKRCANLMIDSVIAAYTGKPRDVEISLRALAICKSRNPQSGDGMKLIAHGRQGEGSMLSVVFKIGKECNSLKRHTPFDMGKKWNTIFGKSGLFEVGKIVVNDTENKICEEIDKVINESSISYATLLSLLDHNTLNEIESISLRTLLSTLLERVKLAEEVGVAVIG